MNDRDDSRRWVITLLVSGLSLLLLFRLFYLQVLDPSYRHKASDIGRETIYPARGLMYDRNGELMVSNEPAYDILVIRSEIRNLDTARLAVLLDLPDSLIRARFHELEANRLGYYSPWKPALLVSHLRPEQVAAFQEKLFAFPGFYIRTRSARYYPFAVAAHVLGDIGEVNDAEIRQHTEVYEPGDLIGKSGLERYYESRLRGQKGVHYYLKDKMGRPLGEFENGQFDTMAVRGQDLTTTLDIRLQAYGEWLMEGKRGSIVAIDPSTGGILALVSSPGYDPNLLVGRQRGEQYSALLRDSVNKPLINRPLSAQYPPGSTFKPLMALIALQEGTLRTNTGFPCHGGFTISGLHVGCHNHPAIHNLTEAIQHSCNAYFCNAFAHLIESGQYRDEKEALATWARYLNGFGLGRLTGVDLPSEGKGFVPGPEYYDKLYQGYRWRASTIISAGIGQGELLVTPLQLANAYAIIANGGWFYPPHLAMSFNGDTTGLGKYYHRQNSGIDPEYFDAILDGLQEAVDHGTARLARVDSVTVCGKTGTAQNPHGKDHSIFAAFAPRENPKIAIAVVVENAGFGGTWAAPIAGLMIEKYLKGYIPRQKKWLENYVRQKIINYAAE